MDALEHYPEKAFEENDYAGNPDGGTIRSGGYRQRGFMLLQ